MNDRILGYIGLGTLIAFFIILWIEHHPGSPGVWLTSSTMISTSSLRQRPNQP